MIFKFATVQASIPKCAGTVAPVFAVWGSAIRRPMLRIVSSVLQTKCFLQTDRGENHGNCEKTSGKESRSCESSSKNLGLWDDVMVVDLKHFDGSLRPIDRVPQDIKSLYATAFEIETSWLVEAGSRRQKWIDQAQSLNIYMAGASGKKLDETYKLAWVRGLKTTYYLRTQSATHVEKSTVTAGKMNSVSSGSQSKAASMSAIDKAAAAAQAQLSASPATDIKFCAIDDPGCEACQ